jgi:hypothetical protein
MAERSPAARLTDIVEAIALIRGDMAGASSTSSTQTFASAGSPSAALLKGGTGQEQNALQEITYDKGHYHI